MDATTNGGSTKTAQENCNQAGSTTTPETLCESHNDNHTIMNEAASNDENCEQASSPEAPSSTPSSTSAPKTMRAIKNGTTTGTQKIRKCHCDSLVRDKTWILRACFVLSLLTAAVICGFSANKVIGELEVDLAKQTYESVATMALTGAQAITRRKLQGAQLMSSIMSHAFPDKSAWPFVALAGYVDISEGVATLTSSTTVAINMIVYPEQAAQFEEHARQVYQEQGYPETAGVSEFGFGIFAQSEDPEVTNNATDGRYRDVSGETSYGSKYKLMAPIFQHNSIDARSLLLNVHAPEVQGKAVDGMLDCTAAEASRNQVAGLKPKAPECGVVTNFMELIVRPGPASLLYHPVYPAQDPTTMVAM